MRGHSEYQRALAAYRGLEPAARVNLDAHLLTCSACAARLAGYEQVEEALRALPEPRLPVRLQHPWPVVAAQHKAAAGIEKSNGRIGWGVALGRALLPASLVLALLVGAWLLLSSVTGGGVVATATPTMTLTPTATVIAWLEGDAGALVEVVPVTAVAPVPLPAPPSPVAAWAGAGVAQQKP